MDEEEQGGDTPSPQPAQQRNDTKEKKSFYDLFQSLIAANPKPQPPRRSERRMSKRVLQSMKESSDSDDDNDKKCIKQSPK